MADFNPLTAAGLLWRRVSPDGYRFAGSCFGFRHPDSWLTAAHCVVGARVSDVRLIAEIGAPQILEASGARRLGAEVEPPGQPRVSPSALILARGTWLRARGSEPLLTALGTSSRGVTNFFSGG